MFYFFYFVTLLLDVVTRGMINIDQRVFLLSLTVFQNAAVSFFPRILALSQRRISKTVNSLIMTVGGKKTRDSVYLYGSFVSSEIINFRIYNNNSLD